MKYLFLAYRDEEQLAALPLGEREDFLNACLANREALRQSGHLLAGENVQRSSAAIAVRFQNGQIALQDGPFAETQEQLVELFFINARDLNEAIRVATQMPQAQKGAIEVRPMIEQQETTRL